MHKGILYRPHEKFQHSIEQLDVFWTNEVLPSFDVLQQVCISNEGSATVTAVKQGLLGSTGRIEWIGTIESDDIIVSRIGFDSVHRGDLMRKKPESGLIVLSGILVERCNDSLAILDVHSGSGQLSSLLLDIERRIFDILERP
ncbi:hypothetical protein PRIPAC_87960 [Pristionchus pacificus]|uniref:Uncharacterized protein n=1 Tax=Pristionchus pacificus TaxID=54126 RepID=A0A2A6CWR7_PRIPA|nr:hypothetical protein PRIPAC_87960 [Pristionchus pacificus]|eukprot:PDM82526.1 hypothetical protein PRIPAC_36919 [Pristionchus pacificus]